MRPDESLVSCQPGAFDSRKKTKQGTCLGSYPADTMWTPLTRTFKLNPPQKRKTTLLSHPFYLSFINRAKSKQ